MHKRKLKFNLWKCYVNLLDYYFMLMLGIGSLNPTDRKYELKAVRNLLDIRIVLGWKWKELLHSGGTYKSYSNSNKIHL